MKYEELIDNFLFGRMSPEEEISFLNECKSNKELKKEAIMMALLIKTVKKLHEKSFSPHHRPMPASDDERTTACRRHH